MSRQYDTEVEGMSEVQRFLAMIEAEVHELLGLSSRDAYLAARHPSELDAQSDPYPAPDITCECQATQFGIIRF